MKKLGLLVLIGLVVGCLLVPASASAAKGRVMTSGSMTLESPQWSVYPGEPGPFTYKWKWNAVEGPGDKAAKGQLVLTVSRPSPVDGTIEVVDTRSVDVVGVTDLGGGVVEFTTDQRIYTPGDPAWGDNVFRTVDNGKTGDELWQHCWEHDTFHLLNSGGHIRSH